MRKIPPPIWAALAIMLTLGASALAPSLPLIDQRFAPLGLVLALIGLVISVWSVILFGRAGTDVRPDSPTNKALIVNGPYHVTRNPMYLGLVLITLGAAFWLRMPLVFLAPVITFAICSAVHIPMEEAKMGAQFGAAFDDYAHKVRRWI